MLAAWLAHILTYKEAYSSWESRLSYNLQRLIPSESGLASPYLLSLPYLKMLPAKERIQTLESVGGSSQPNCVRF